MFPTTARKKVCKISVKGQSGQRLKAYAFATEQTCGPITNIGSISTRSEREYAQIIRRDAS